MRDASKTILEKTTTVPVLSQACRF